MQPAAPISRRKALFILIALLVAFGVIIWLISLLTQEGNPFGKFIKIQNYDAKVKNVPIVVRDGTESSLYNTVVLNVEESFNATRVTDAYIREGSETQSKNGEVYSGTYIVDIESIKQSYGVEYSYSKEVRAGGDPIIISCLPREKLKYGAFDCKDIYSTQSEGVDPIIGYLPYQNFSFKLTPDATQGDTLVIVATLTIPEVDLKGDQTSRAQAVASYKQQVRDWILSKGLSPDNYIIKYNYDDSGNIIIVDNDHID